ncbi:hypothetical protein EP7_001156 [Isosphaeraceae bacterium EP7]
MATKNRRIHALALGLSLTATLILGADAPPKTVDVGGLTFEIPATWKEGKPTSSMRKAQISIPASKGDNDPGELVVFVFPGGAGSVESNVSRWQGQFKSEDGELPKVESKKVKGKNTDVTRVKIAGRYLDPFSKAGVKPGYQLLGAIVQTDDAGYFIKTIGPAKTIDDAEKAFDALIKSMNVTKK